MAHPSEVGTLVLHGLRLKGFAETDVVAEAVNLADPEVVGALEGFAADGLVSRRDGSRSGWSLTTEGRAEGERRIVAELAQVGADDLVEEAYQGFVGLNDGFLQVTTDWQLRPVAGDDLNDRVTNDHTDEAYDADVVQRLAGIDVAVGPVCEGLSTGLERFAGYRPRLSHALDRVRAGHADWFARPMMDSYHSVWFELHEDLLVTLGLNRATET